MIRFGGNYPLIFFHALGLVPKWCLVDPCGCALQFLRCSLWCKVIQGFIGSNLIFNVTDQPSICGAPILREVKSLKDSGFDFSRIEIVVAIKGAFFSSQLLFPHGRADGAERQHWDDLSSIMNSVFLSSSKDRLMTDGIFCLYSVKKTHGLSTDEDPLISVELLVLKFIPEIHIQTKTGHPGNLVYPPVLIGYDLNRYFSVRPIWTSYLLKLTPPTEKEKKIWQKFEQKLYLETEDEEKRSIALDHPIVSDIGNFAVFTYNKACNMHVKMVEHNLHDIEFMECKYKKAGPIYYFNVTIEAIEEGNLGIYEAEVFCESVGYSRSLYKFNLTNRKPFGM
ncbi:hypothetical protein Tco_0199413 [Tanacetum coccineum]